MGFFWTGCHELGFQIAKLFLRYVIYWQKLKYGMTEWHNELFRKRNKIKYWLPNVEQLWCLALNVKVQPMDLNPTENMLIWYRVHFLLCLSSFFRKYLPPSLCWLSISSKIMNPMWFMIRQLSLYWHHWYLLTGSGSWRIPPNSEKGIPLSDPSNSLFSQYEKVEGINKT